MSRALGAASRRFSTYKTLVSSLDWFFPPHCAGCGEPGFHWCPACQSQVSLLSAPLCPSCGLPGEVASRCASCRERAPAYDRARSWAYYTGNLRAALLSLKYRRDLSLATIFAEALSGLLAQLGWEPDILVPIPLGRQRFLQRGYNQVETIVRPLALITGTSTSNQALVRTKETVSQVGLGVETRWKNLSRAFTARPERMRGKHVLLVDDVMTTGATLSAAAEALNEAGAESVSALTLARTPSRELADS